MTVTTHITTTCLLTVLTAESDVGTALKLLILTLGSLALHFLMDLLPHGFIATPWTIFKKCTPTLLELVPGTIILIAVIAIFGQAHWFVFASFFGLLPDLAAVWTDRVDRGKTRVGIPGFTFLQRFHRKVHWFEKDHPRAEMTYTFPNRPLLLAEMVGTAALVVVLFYWIRA